MQLIELNTCQQKYLKKDISLRHLMLSLSVHYECASQQNYQYYFRSNLSAKVTKKNLKKRTMKKLLLD